MAMVALALAYVSLAMSMDVLPLTVIAPGILVATAPSATQ